MRTPRGAPADSTSLPHITTVPCKQLASMIDEIDAREEIFHNPAHKEDEGMRLCADAFMGGKRAAIIMQNTVLG